MLQSWLNARSIRHVVTLSVVALLIAAAAACSGSGKGGGGTATTPSQTATITAEVKDSYGTSLGTVAFSATVGTRITITMADLKAKGLDTSELAGDYLVARYPPEYGTYGLVVGAFIASTEQDANRALGLWVDGSKQLVIYGLTINGAPDYPRAFATPGFGRDMAARELTVRALKIGETMQLNRGSTLVTADGTEADKVAAVDRLNAALQLKDGVRLGYVKYLGYADYADAGMGFYSSSLGGEGMHGLWSFAANDKYASRPDMARCALYTQGVEMLLRFDKLFGRDSIEWLCGFWAANGVTYVRAGALFAPSK